MLRRLALAVIAIGALVVAFTGTQEIGFSVTSENGVEHVSAGSGLTALAAAFILIVLYLVALDPEPSEAPDRPASTTRRALAWFFDFFVSFVAIASLFALIPLASEALATGHFQWQFERDAATTSDWIVSLVLVGAVFAGMAVYWGLPPVRGGQTIGQAVFRLRVVSATADPPRMKACLLRGLLQPFAPLLWFTRFFSSRGSYFHDDLASVQVVTTRISARAA